MNFYSYIVVFAGYVEKKSRLLIALSNAVIKNEAWWAVNLDWVLLEANGVRSASVYRDLSILKTLAWIALSVGSAHWNDTRIRTS